MFTFYIIVYMIVNIENKILCNMHLQAAFFILLT